MASVDQILRENKARSAQLNAAYDPVRGIGSYIDRVELELDKGNVIRIPRKMAEEDAGTAAVLEAGSLEQLVSKHRVSFDRAYTDFLRVRLEYDYEFWCATGAKIQDKAGVLVPLVLNRPQRRSFADRYAEWNETGRVRQIELKHRQYGSTTEKNAFVFFLQNIVFTGKRAIINGLDDDQARDIRERYELIAQHHPSPVIVVGASGQTRTRRIVGRRCTISVGSSKSPLALSGRTAQIILLSEAGKYPSTTQLTAEKLITNLVSLLPREDDTFEMVESTAEESGVWFRNAVERARNGEGSRRFTFINWIEDETRQEAPDDYRAFVSSWNDYNRMCWDLGATIEQIQWYVEKAKEYDEPWLMQQENPTTPDEAFNLGDRYIFQPHMIQTLSKSVRQPIRRGRLVADALTGEGAFDNIGFIDDPKGPLEIWIPRDQTYSGTKPNRAYRNRWLCASDVGGVWAKADWSVAWLMDRLPTIANPYRMPATAAQYRDRLDTDLFAWEVARLLYWYSKGWREELPLWAPEINSMRKEVKENQLGQVDTSITVVDLMKLIYPNLYEREVVDKRITTEKIRKVGWFTGPATKPGMLVALQKHLRQFHRYENDEADPDEGGWLEHDAVTVAELRTIIRPDRGTYEAAPGKKDDCVDVRGIGLYLHDLMPQPKLVPLPKAKQRRRGQKSGPGGRKRTPVAHY